MAKKTSAEKRLRQIVVAVFHDVPTREVARKFQVALGTVQFWLRRVADLNARCIRFYALRRREAAWQPLLCEVLYILPKRRFNE